MSEPNLPGRWLARLAPWLVDAVDFERAVEPALADLHFEWSALRAGKRARAASFFALSALAHILLVLLPTLVVRRRARRLVEARWAPLVPALAAAALGTWAFRDAAPSPSYVTHQLAFVGAGLVLALAAGTTSKEGWLRFGPAWGVSSLLSLALALAGDEAFGVRRWATLGPLRVQTSLLVWPLFIVGLASLVEQKRHKLALAFFASAMLLIAAQRDLATALPWALAACSTLYMMRASRLVKRVAIGVAGLGVGLSFTLAAALPPLPHVEGVWGLLARQSALGVLGALTCAALILIAPFYSTHRTIDRFLRGTMAGSGVLLAGLFLRPLVADEPVPLLGYGGSGALGVLLGLGLVAGLSGPSRAGVRA